MMDCSLIENDKQEKSEPENSSDNWVCARTLALDAVRVGVALSITVLVIIIPLRTLSTNPSRRSGFLATRVITIVRPRIR